MLELHLWYLFEYAGFYCLMQVQQYIYLQDTRKHTAAVSQRRNDHMQVFITIMEGKKNSFHMNGLIVNRLTGTPLMSF